MKIVSSFVTNSSSTSFVVVQKKKIDKEFFLEHFGMSPGNILYKTFCNWFDALNSRLRQVPAGTKLFDYLEKERVNVDDEDRAEILERYNNGEKVYYGFLSTDGDSGGGAEVYFASDSIIIIDEDFYFTNRHMQP